MFSFECVNTQHCKKMITDADNQQAYIDNGLKPLLKYIADNNFNDQVHAIEMFNEPEWMIVGGSGVNQKVFNDESKGLARVQEFTTKCNKEIQNAGFKATVGSASLKWSCTTGHWCVGDWWADTNIDFRTVHYYSWMAYGGNQFDPFSSKPSDWGLTGDVLIGESPSYTDDSFGHGKISV